MCVVGSGVRASRNGVRRLENRGNGVRRSGSSGNGFVAFVSIFLFFNEILGGNSRSAKDG